MEENCQQENDSIFKVAFPSSTNIFIIMIARGITRHLKLEQPFLSSAPCDIISCSFAFWPVLLFTNQMLLLPRIYIPSAQSMCTVAWLCLQGAWEGMSFPSSSPTSAALCSWLFFRFSPSCLPGWLGITISEEDKEKDSSNLLFSAPTQQQFPVRISALRVKPANMPNHFCHRLNQVRKRKIWKNEIIFPGPIFSDTLYSGTTDSGSRTNSIRSNNPSLR